MVAGAAIYGAAYFLPNRYEISQTQLIDAAPEQVFSYLNNPTEWPKWTVWTKQNDPTLIHMYGGPLAGVGARQSWSGDEMGESEIVFTQSTSPSILAYDQTSSDESRNQGTFTLEEASGGTQLSWVQVTELPDKPLAKLAGVWQKYKTEQELKQSLLNLKDLMHQNNIKRASKE